MRNSPEQPGSQEQDPVDETERRLNQIAEQHGGILPTPKELLEMAEAADMYADELQAKGFPDKAEAEGERRNRLRADAEFLMSLSETEQAA